MPRREFEDDLGVVGEVESFGGLMPVMEGRRSDYARLKQLKANGLYERMSTLCELLQQVQEEWTAVYGTPNSKKWAQEQIKKRGSSDER